MSKAKKYGINGALSVGVANALINALTQLNSIEQNSQLKFDWKKLLIAGGKGVAIGGMAGWVIGSFADHKRSSEKLINTDAFLNTLASKITLKRTDRKYLLLCDKADQLSNELKNEFWNKLKSEPIRIGSTEKETALKNNFDIDICFSFKPYSFRSTAAMFGSVYSFLKNCIGKFSIVDVIDQKKSIAVIFDIEGEQYKVDIVPIKLTLTRKNFTSGYLFKNNKSLFGTSSYTKTNLQLIKSIRFSSVQKKIIVILKNWKQANDLPLSSYLLENLVLESYSYNVHRIPKKFTEKIIMVLNFIANNLSVTVIRSVENSNNILTNISAKRKSLIINACVKAIEEYEYHPNTIINTFAE